MSRFVPRALFALALLPAALVAVPAVAADAAVAAVANAPQANPQVVVQTAIDSLTARIVKDRKQLQKSQAALTQLVEQNITPFVDIPGIARGVMGQFYRQATPEQRDHFITVFKQSLVRTYANGLASYNNQKIVVKPYKPGDDMNRAQVDVEVSLDNGTVVPVTFQMVRDASGAWKARNLLVNGLNLGLTFRNRFAEVMQASGNSIDKAIAGWSAEPIDVSKDKS